jgi:uncharacterized membrane protein YfcA
MMARMTWPDPAGWAVLVLGAVVGSTVGGVAGFGAGLILLPLVTWTLGVRAVGPVLTVTMLVGNVSRIWWSRGDVDAAVVVRFLIGAVPTTVLGAALYAGARSQSLRLVIGGFLLASVVLRRVLMSGRFQVRLGYFPFVGAGFGVLSGMVVTTGPVVAPFFLAYGLRRGAFIGTEAVCAMVLHLTRGITFARYAVLTWDAVAIGAVLGATMFAGSWFARQLLDRMSDRIFLAVVEVLLVLLGLQFLLGSG